MFTFSMFTMKMYQQINFSNARRKILEYSTLLEIVAAMHLSSYVESPFEKRGGLMLVAPPNGMKTTITETLDEFPKTHVVTDINVQTLLGMKEIFLGGEILTLAFSDFAKLYKRHGSTAENLEGIIMALAEEGFRKASFQHQSVSAIPARVTIVGGMTTSFYDSKAKDWMDNGFMRRFLWARYIVNGMDVMEDAAAEWRKARLDGDFTVRIPVSRSIPHRVEPKEMKEISYIIRHQSSRVNASITLQKILSVLRWKFQRHPERPMQIIKDFAPCLGKEGGILYVKEKNEEQHKDHRPIEERIEDGETRQSDSSGRRMGGERPPVRDSRARVYRERGISTPAVPKSNHRTVNGNKRRAEKSVASLRKK